MTKPRKCPAIAPAGYVTHNLRGKRIHDANIVATMAVHGIHILLTQNGADFAPFNDIAIVAIPDVAVDG